MHEGNSCFLASWFHHDLGSIVPAIVNQGRKPL
jgi:hypothetical protein